MRARFNADDAGAHQLRLTVLDIDGRSLAEMTASIRIPPLSDHQTTTLCIAFPISGMELRSYGEHAIDLALDEHSVLRTPFFVEKPS